MEIELIHDSPTLVNEFFKVTLKVKSLEDTEVKNIRYCLFTCMWTLFRSHLSASFILSFLLTVSSSLGILWETRTCSQSRLAPS